jgi:hypothetical protein
MVFGRDATGFFGSTLDECQHGILNVLAMDVTRDFKNGSASEPPGTFKNGGADEQPKPVITTTANWQQKIKLLHPPSLLISLSSLIPSSFFSPSSSTSCLPSIFLSTLIKTPI